MKKAISVLIVCLALVGCSGCNPKPKSPSYYDNTTTNAAVQSQFNEENYVWEGFIFSTNRVDNTGN